MFLYRILMNLCTNILTNLCTNILTNLCTYHCYSRLQKNVLPYICSVQLHRTIINVKFIISGQALNGNYSSILRFRNDTCLLPSYMIRRHVDQIEIYTAGKQSQENFHFSHGQVVTETESRSITEGQIFSRLGGIVQPSLWLETFDNVHVRSIR